MTGGASGAGRSWVRAARPYLPALLMAAGYMSPEAAADTISRNLSDDEFEDLLEDIESDPPGFAGRFVKDFPKAASVPAAWFASVVELLLVMGQGEGEEGEAGGGEGESAEGAGEAGEGSNGAPAK